MVKFKDFSRPLSVFQVLFMARIMFKDFSRQSCIFKYFSSLFEPWSSNSSGETVYLHRFLRGMAACIYDMHQNLMNWLI